MFSAAYKKQMDLYYSAMWGVEDRLDIWHMCARAFLMFFITLGLIRIGGMRIFGLKTAFDSILVIMLGAVLGRGIVGASPFFSTVGAALVLVLVHRLLSYLAIRHIWIGKIVKGEHQTLFRDGNYNEKKMNRHGISKDDMQEALRLKLNSNDINDAKEIVIEKSGELSVTRKDR
jgi:uncharacterized membrane protein YcaP (DUF421 family)